jgi:hypothetical protein
MKQKHKCHVLTNENLDDTEARFQHTPRKSLKRLAQETGVSKSSARRATQLLKLRPHKTTAIHALQLRNQACRIHFCNWFLQPVIEGEINLQLTFFSDEVWFHLQGYINIQNNPYWSSQNPHLTQDILLHPVSVGVWCTISAIRIVGPKFFNEIINCKRYVWVILGQFLPQSTEGERLYDWFQLLPTLHVMSTQVLSDIFRDRIISSGIWPAQSPNLSLAILSSGVVRTTKFTRATPERSTKRKYS